jgi:signal transduction histidine kinase
MNGILGFSELLRNNDLSDNERQNCLDVIMKSGQQLLSIINDVLEISQLETGQITLSPNRVNLNRLMNDLFRFFTIEAKEKSVELRCLLPDEDYFLFVDGGKITQIFNNLISNALKYTPSGGLIVFGFEPLADKVRFFVKDNGIGIEPQHHNLIFERFGQVRKAGSKNMGGTGLGLSICKSLVELMGGKIWVESEPGHGSNFVFTLPVKGKKE